MPARNMPRDRASVSNSLACAAAAMRSAADFGTMPTRASAQASAISKSNMACRTELSENTSASGSVVAKLSIRRAANSAPSVRHYTCAGSSKNVNFGNLRAQGEVSQPPPKMSWHCQMNRFGLNYGGRSEETYAHSRCKHKEQY